MATGGQGDGDPSSSRSASLPNPPTTTSTTSIDINKNSTDNGNNYNNSNPPTATEDVAFTTTSSAPVRPSPPTLQLRRSSSGANARLVRRVTTQERLDGILEVIWNHHYCTYLYDTSQGGTILGLALHYTVHTAHYMYPVPLSSQSG